MSAKFCHFPLSLQFFVFYLEVLFFFCVQQMDLRCAFDLQTFLYVYMTLLTEFLLLLLSWMSSIIIITIPILYAISIAGNIIIIAIGSLSLGTIHLWRLKKFRNFWLPSSHVGISLKYHYPHHQDAQISHDPPFFLNHKLTNQSK